MADLGHGRRVRITAWGFSELDAQRAEDQARGEASFFGWQVELVTRVVGGKASEATSVIFSARELRRSVSYDRLYVIYAPPPPVDPALLRAMSNWLRLCQ